MAKIYLLKWHVIGSVNGITRLIGPMVTMGAYRRVFEYATRLFTICWKGDMIYNVNSDTN